MAVFYINLQILFPILVIMPIGFSHNRANTSNKSGVKKGPL